VLICFTWTVPLLCDRRELRSDRPAHHAHIGPQDENEPKITM
jgi:hypothetical protein